MSDAVHTEQSDPPLLRLISRFQNAIGAAMIAVTGVALMVLMFHVVANALARTFFNHPIDGTIEYVGHWYLPLIVLLGLVVAQQRRQHIEARLVFERAPERIRIEFQAVGYMITTVLALIVGWYSYVEAWRGFDIGLTAGVSGVVIWPVTFAVPLGFLLYAIQLVFDTILLFSGDRTDVSPAGTEGK